MNKKSILFISLDILLILSYSTLSLCLKENTDVTALRVLLTDILLLLISALAVIAFLLYRSVKRNIYSYRNIAYIGTALYLFIQLLVLVRYYFSVLSDLSSITAEGILSVITKLPEQFSYFAVPVLAVICLLICISNISLIKHEGFRLKNLLGFLLGGLYIGGTVLLYCLSYFLENSLSDLSSLYTLSILLPMSLLLILCYFECIFVGFIVMSAVAFRHIPEYDKDFIIVLGCSISKKGGLLPLLKGRTNRAIRFAWDQEISTGKKVLYVPSGGQGADEIMSEGSAMELYLLSHGAEPDEVYPEKRSTNTDQNLRFSKEIIDGIKPDAKVAVATTNYHVFRSGLLAQKNGLDAECIASDTKWYFWPNGFVREFFAILAMHKKVHIAVSAVIFTVCAVLTGITYFI